MYTPRQISRLSRAQLRAIIAELQSELRLADQTITKVQKDKELAINAVLRSRRDALKAQAKAHEAALKRASVETDDARTIGYEHEATIRKQNKRIRELEEQVKRLNKAANRDIIQLDTQEAKAS